jgi:[ribosomal protein S5]-alanine N-acetyltransferase
VSLAPATTNLVKIETPRLELVRSTLAMLETELPDRATFAAMLGVPAPAVWPAGLNDERSQQYFIHRTRTEGESDFIGWYIVLREPRQVIGNCGFKTLPHNGCVEVGYSILDAFQRNGYCTEAIRALIERAFRYPEVERVIAETLPHLIASRRVMEKCGMAHVGEGNEEDGMKTIRYEVRRNS